MNANESPPAGTSRGTTQQEPTSDRADQDQFTLPAAPVLSDASQEILADAAERDRQLRRETGHDWWALAALVDELDADELTELCIDGYRWRWYVRPAAVLWRAEREAAGRRRLMVDASHAISGMLGRVGPSWAEMQRRRYPPDGDRRRWVRSGPAEHVNFRGVHRRPGGGAR